MDFLSILAPRSFSDLILLVVFCGGILYLLFSFLSKKFSISFSVSRRVEGNPVRKREVTPKVAVVTDLQREAACKHGRVYTVEVREEGENWHEVVDYDYKCAHCTKRSANPFGNVVKN